MLAEIGMTKMPPKPKLVPRRRGPVDIPFNTAPGYMAQREPGSDYKWKLMQYESRKRELDDRKMVELKEELLKDTIKAKYMTHTEKISFKKQVEKRVEQKLEEYDRSFEERRKKLADLFWLEERQYVRETVEQAHEGATYQFEQMKLRVEELRARREAERIALRDEKKLQQSINNCDEFRPLISQMKEAEARKAQLAQMKDNENKKESEREIERFWHEIMLKEIAAKNEREEQDQLKIRRSKVMNVGTWDIQMQEKVIREQEEAREKEEDRIKMDKVREELIREEIKYLDSQRRERDKLLKEAQEEIRAKEELMKRRAQEEQAVMRAYEQLVELEIERDKQKSTSNAEEAKREMLQFMEYVQQLERERQEEEKVLDALVEEARREIERKQNEVFCKLERAKRQLKEATMKGLKDQMEFKKKEAEEQLKFKQVENELLRLQRDQNDRLRAEYERQQILQSKQYKADLQKQIEYRKLLNEREKEEIEHQLQIGLEEEEKYKRVIASILTGDVKIGKSHPFKSTLDQIICQCPEKIQFKK